MSASYISTFVIWSCIPGGISVIFGGIAWIGYNIYKLIVTRSKDRKAFNRILEPFLYSTGSAGVISVVMGHAFNLDYEFMSCLVCAIMIPLEYIMLKLHDIEDHLKDLKKNQENESRED